MAVKPGCFAISQTQNLSSTNRQLLEGALQKQPDVWSEGVPLLLAFDCYVPKVFCPLWHWNRGPGWLSSQGVLQSHRQTPNLSPNRQLLEGATPETT